MTPYYEHAGITIYHGDCREWFAAPTAERADLILTDPPYGLGDRWKGGTWGAAPMYADARRWDREIPFDVVAALPSCCPVSIVWGGNLYPLPPSRCWLAWIKSSQIPTMADFELAWTNLDRPSKAWTEDRNPDGRRQHPTQKPLSLMEWCLGLVPFARCIFDPFMGSGTILIAAKNLGRRAIGIEIEERYCEIAARRLAQEVFPLGDVA